MTANPLMMKRLTMKQQNRQRKFRRKKHPKQKCRKHLPKNSRLKISPRSRHNLTEIKTAESAVTPDSAVLCYRFSSHTPQFRYSAKQLQSRYGTCIHAAAGEIFL